MTHGGNVWQGDSPDRWLDYSANIRPGGPPDWVRKVLNDAMENAAYYPDPSMSASRAALAAFMSLPEAAVLPTAGGISALSLALAQGEGPVVIFTPCFSEYAQLARRAGREVRFVPMPEGPIEPNSFDWPRGGTVCVCNPNNPTGRAFEREEIEPLVKRAEEVDGYLLVDEAFIDYCIGYTQRALVRQSERVMIAGSMTKILGIPGVRLGYLCASEKTLAACAARQLTWELSAFAAAVCQALPGRDGSLLSDALDNALWRDSFTSRLKSLGVHVYPSKASFVLARFRSDVSLIASRLKERGILVRECMDFQGIDDGHHLRLAVKDNKTNYRFINALKEVLK